MDYSKINRNKSYVVRNTPKAFSVLLKTEHEPRESRALFDALYDRGLTGQTAGKYAIMSGRAILESWGVTFGKVEINDVSILDDCVTA